MMPTLTSTPVSRRAFVGGVAAGPMIAAATAAGPAFAADPPQFVPGAPLSKFNKESTAEEVTAGIDLAGKTILITGANSGLGYETMRVLTMRGAHVLALARTKEKAAEACATVTGKTTPFGCELTDFADVARCAAEVKALNTPIDVLICNAGIMALPEPEQINGIEKHFVVNHLSHFILVNHLIETVKAAPQGRFVTVSSLGYRWAPATGIEFDNLDGKRDYVPNKMYGQSKLANHLMTRELARRLAGTTTTANSVHPGVINTNLGRHMPWYTRLAARLMGWTFMKSVEQGAATTCYVASAPALAQTSGLYFEDCNPVVPGFQMENDELTAKLWTVSEDLTREYLPKAEA